MPITYSSAPDHAHRQPAASTLTEAQADELSQRQSQLLPEVNLGGLVGRIALVQRLGGRLVITARAGGMLRCEQRLNGRLVIR